MVIENEYLPANMVEVEARERLGERLDASVVEASGKVNAALALRSPVDLHDCAGLDDVDSLLKRGVTLEYALLTGSSDVDFTRFPHSGSSWAASGTSRRSWSTRRLRRMRSRER